MSDIDSDSIAEDINDFIETLWDAIFDQDGFLTNVLTQLWDLHLIPTLQGNLLGYGAATALVVLFTGIAFYIYARGHLEWLTR